MMYSLQNENPLLIQLLHSIDKVEDNLIYTKDIPEYYDHQLGIKIK